MLNKYNHNNSTINHKEQIISKNLNLLINNKIYKIKIDQNLEIEVNHLEYLKNKKTELQLKI